MTQSWPWDNQIVVKKASDVMSQLCLCMGITIAGYNFIQCQEIKKG